MSGSAVTNPSDSRDAALLERARKLATAPCCHLPLLQAARGIVRRLAARERRSVLGALAKHVQHQLAVPRRVKAGVAAAVATAEGRVRRRQCAKRHESEVIVARVAAGLQRIKGRT